jgi:hypothetical protein
VTYQKDIRPLIESNCLGCHVQGGIGPFPLDTWDAVNAVNARVVAAVTSGLMPPWPADSACRDLADAPTLTAKKRDLFTAWQMAGFPEGNASDYVAPAKVSRVDLGKPTFTLASPEAYTPAASSDDYRCFLLDKVFDNASYWTGMDIVPEQVGEVHHVQIHRITAAQRTMVEGLDAAAAGAGYPCLNGTGVQSQNLFSWRPGSLSVSFDKGDAVYIEAGSSIVIQVHYNTVFLPKGDVPTPDTTKINLWALPDGELPDRIIFRTGTVAQFLITAGNPSVVATSSTTMGMLPGLSRLTAAGAKGEIIGMTPHAHQLASKMSANVTTGAGKECLINVPDWDFHWQLDYMFVKPVPFAPTDSVTVTCEYDNSAENQPVIDGVRQTPRTVAWGETSLDEMCLHYIWVRYDRATFLGTN